jgi:hypothetical protein
MKSLLFSLAAAAALSGCVAVPVAQPRGVYVVPAPPPPVVVVRPRPYYHYGYGPRYQRYYDR